MRIPGHPPLTERVYEVLSLADEVCQRLGAPAVTAEHILVGIIREGEGVAATVLYNRKVPREDVVIALEGQARGGSDQEAGAGDETCTILDAPFPPGHPGRAS
jgi:ATP-dependent Clp protease ATP-binding subunit ClpA